MAQAQQPPGWYTDPQGEAQLRYWDGNQWTPHVQNPPEHQVGGAPTTDVIVTTMNELPGYDIRPAEPAILRALRSKDLAGLAVEAAGHLPGRQPQLMLAAVVLSGTLPEALRSAAASELCHHIQNHGLLLSADQVKGLESLFDSMGDSKLKANVSLVTVKTGPI